MFCHCCFNVQKAIQRISYFFYAALSLKCQSCGTGDVPCGGPNVKSIYCEAVEDRCMTVTMTKNLTIGGPESIIIKNCSHSTKVCEEDGAGYRKCHTQGNFTRRACGVYHPERGSLIKINGRSSGNIKRS